MHCQINTFSATLFFPPSLGEGTDGKGIFGDWAWWTGRSLRLILECDCKPNEDPEALRTEAIENGNLLLKRFLLSYRWRLNEPAVHPVLIDPRAMSLEILHDDGHKELLSEPVSSLFYQTLPSKPPLATSLNVETLAAIRTDILEEKEPTHTVLLSLDADQLERQGETSRAEFLRELIDK